jgi:hypothetical protein
MKLRNNLNLVIVTIAFLLAASAAAKTKHSDDVIIRFDATVAGSHLASGNYDIRWETHSPEATVSFLQGSKVMATAEGKVVDGEKKYSSNEVVFEQNADGVRVIREIHFRGLREILVFNQ